MTDDLHPSTPFEAALLYGVMGWRVAPLPKNVKWPYITEWQKRASTDPSIIMNWWADGASDSGVCIVTGRETGMWVLDVDVKDGKDGVATLRALIAENGGEPLPETLVARTPTGGYHYFFKYPETGEISTVKDIGEGLDVRGDRGQVNAAPTQHFDLPPYRWVPGRGPMDIGEAAFAPQWLEDKARERLPVMPVMTPEEEKELRQYANEKRPDFANRYIAEHTWTDMLTRDEWTLSRRDANSVEYWTRPGKDERDGTSATVNWGGFDLLRVFTTSVNFLDAGSNYNRWAYMVFRDHGGNFKDAARKYSDRVSDDEIAAMMPTETETAKDPEPAAGSPVPEEKDPETDPKQSIMQVHQIDFSPDGPFWNRDLDQSDFLIEPFLARGRGHALYATAKVGKSYVALQAIAAACVPDHESWADPVDELITVLYLDYEMTEADLRERLEMFGYSKKDDYSRLHYIRASAIGADLDTEVGGQVLLAHAQLWKVDLVVVDTLSRAVRGDENDADTARDFYRCTGGPLKAEDITLLRIDHAGKTAEKGQRGTSGKNDDVDVVWRMDRKDTGVTLVRTHTRVSWLPELVTLAYKEDDDGGARHVRSALGGWGAGVPAKAAELDEANAPLSVNKWAALHTYGIHGKGQLLNDAIRYRKQNATRGLLVNAVPEP